MRESGLSGLDLDWEILAKANFSSGFKLGDYQSPSTSPPARMPPAYHSCPSDVRI